MATRTPVEIDRERISELSAREESKLDDRTPARATCTSGPEDAGERSLLVVPGSRAVADVPLARQGRPGLGRRRKRHARLPQRVRLDGAGARPSGDLEQCDRVSLGTHFAAPVEDDVVVGEELARRFGLPKWRYVNSGSEATMDAIRIARAATGRDTIVKIFGSYHGHHDYVMVSIGVPYDRIGDRDNLASLPYGKESLRASSTRRPVPFNDAVAMERRIERLIEDRKPACVIMEAAMMNLGVVLPEPGYLESVRELTRKHGIILIFDEVKTGLCIAAGGATERFGVLPDMVTLAKALGGGLPSGAIGASEEVMEVVEDGSVYQVGTYNGNPLSMAAARRPARGADPGGVHAPGRAERASAQRLRRGDREVQPTRLRSRRRLEGLRHVLPKKIVDYETFKENQDADLCDLAWLYNMNRGIYATPGREEEWTLSVTPHRRGLRSLRRGVRGDGRRSDAVRRTAEPGGQR